MAARDVDSGTEGPLVSGGTPLGNPRLHQPGSPEGGSYSWGTLIPEVTPAEAAEAMRNGAVLLDVREPFEVATAHIDGALPIPMGDISGRIDEIPRDQTVLCMCHHGGRSAEVATYLARQGLDVANVAGGIDQWSISHDPDVPRYT